MVDDDKLSRALFHPRRIYLVGVRLETLGYVPERLRQLVVLRLLEGHLLVSDRTTVYALRQPAVRPLEILLRQGGLVYEALQFRESVSCRPVLSGYNILAPFVVLVQTHYLSFTLIHLLLIS